MLTYSDAVVLGGHLHATCLHVEQRFIHAWTRAQNHHEPAVRVTEAARYFRLKESWSRLADCYAECVARVERGNDRTHA